MKKAILGVLFLFLIGTMAAVPAFAGTLSTNGPANDNFEAWSISGYAVSDSFTISTTSTVTGATFDAWLYPGDTLSSVGWSIGTSPFGGTSATVITTGVFDFTNGSGYDVYTESITIPSLVLANGTYWFSLQNAIGPNGDGAFWDINNGPSVAWESLYGNVNGKLELGSNSETFQIMGNTTVTPEPGSFLLLGTGLATLAGLIRSKIQA